MTILESIARILLGVTYDKAHFPPRGAGLRALTPWFKGLWFQKVLRFNGRAPWPMNPTCRISDREKLHFPIGEVHNFQSIGVYFQNFSADIYLGTGVYIAPNVGLITANHDPTDLSRHLPGGPIHIGDHSWIGMNSVILPGVTLGPRTIVAAGAVVTRSFEAGECTLAGVPARIIRRLPSGDDGMTN